MSKTRSTISIAIVEDSDLYASALMHFFQLPGSTIECKAVYKSAEQALEEIPKDPPAVVLMDINLPGKNGIECILMLKERFPSLICLILTMYEEHHLIFDSLRAGASGYLLKRTPPSEIVDALHDAQNGGSPMSPHIARQVVEYFHGGKKAVPEADLTPREKEVLDLLIAGKLYKEIAGELCVSIDTVRSHIRKVYKKLSMNSRTEIILKFGKGQR